jgi:cytochrome P450
MFLSSAWPAVMFVLVAFIASESPRWLFRHGRKEKALAVLMKCRDQSQAELDGRAGIGGCFTLLLAFPGHDSGRELWTQAFENQMHRNQGGNITGMIDDATAPWMKVSDVGLPAHLVAGHQRHLQFETAGDKVLGQAFLGRGLSELLQLFRIGKIGFMEPEALMAGICGD